MAENSSASQVPTTDQPKPARRFLGWFQKPKPTGASCEYCGWHGPRSEVLMSPRLNEDGAVYQIATCPDCLRNGGLTFHD